MAITDRVRELVVPLLEPMKLSLYDLELNGGTLRVTVEGSDGVLLDQLAELTKALSRVLDEHDPMPGTYTLEVSSPGLERRLRTEAHFVGAVGEQISVKLGPHIDCERRLRGRLAAVDSGTITLLDEAEVTHVVSLDDITKAATVFEWEPAPKPGSRGSRKANKGAGQGTAPSDKSERRAAVQ